MILLGVDVVRGAGDVHETADSKDHEHERQLMGHEGIIHLRGDVWVVKLAERGFVQLRDRYGVVPDGREAGELWRRRGLICGCMTYIQAACWKYILRSSVASSTGGKYQKRLRNRSIRMVSASKVRGRLGAIGKRPLKQRTSGERSLRRFVRRWSLSSSLFSSF